MQRSLKLSAPIGEDTLEIHYTAYLEYRVSNDPYCHFTIGIQEVEVDKVTCNGIDICCLPGMFPVYTLDTCTHIATIHAQKEILNYEPDIKLDDLIDWYFNI